MDKLDYGLQASKLFTHRVQVTMRSLPNPVKSTSITVSPELG